jgi:hypothetical protein
MNLSSMISEIILIIDQKYNTSDECLDIIKIKNLCKLYKSKSPDSKLSLTDIDFSTPDINKIKHKKTKSTLKINTPEFQRIYSLFIKILYSCLKLGVDIFDTDSNNSNNPVTIKNNYQLIKSIELCKKKYILEHIEILKSGQKNLSSTDISSYEIYIKSDYLVKMKILNKLIGWINIFEKNDNLLSLVLPYFYTYTQYIEEYVG